MNENEEKVIDRANRVKRNKRIIIVSFVCAVLLIVVCASVPGLLGEGSKIENETNPPVDPSKLYETKEEGFNILEYDEYLKYDRSIYINDAANGVLFNVDKNSAALYGEEYSFVYELMQILIKGDIDAYNGIVGEKLEREYFTQQQLYDIVMTKKSETTQSGDKGFYTEYVVMIEYKIHENNGTYRNDILPDASHPQYLVINDSSGELLLMDIIEIVLKK
jgi:hypothetical protein